MPSPPPSLQLRRAGAGRGELAIATHIPPCILVPVFPFLYGTILIFVSIETHSWRSCRCAPRIRSCAQRTPSGGRTTSQAGIGETGTSAGTECRTKQGTCETGTHESAEALHPSGGS